MLKIKEGLTFDDILLVPKYSTVRSRKDIDLSVEFNNGAKFKHPIIPANMKTITGAEMAGKVIDSGGLAILHRFMPAEEQVHIAEDLLDFYEDPLHLAMSVGVKKDDKENLAWFHSVGVRTVCVDVAHGDSISCEEMVAWIKNRYPTMFIIAGNVATSWGAKRLWLAGANAVKVGIGPGSLCSTRIETGAGVPQLTALEDVSWMRKDLMNESTKPLYIIADGGCKSAGDLVKSLCFADMVMTGNLFAGCEETPGHVMMVNGQAVKEYVGSSTHRTNHVEGVAALVHAKGKFEDVLTRLLEGIRSGCSYQGVSKVSDLQEEPDFIRMTGAGLRESHPHDVMLK